MSCVNLFAAACMAMATAALGTPLADRAPSFSVVETANVPPTWKNVGAADPGMMLQMQIGLKQQNMDGLQAKLLELSNPKSSSYGKWLSKEQLESYTRPDAKSTAAVKSWLAASGIPTDAISQPSPDWIHVRVPVGKAEAMLNAKYSMFQDASSASGMAVPRVLRYSLPAGVDEHVDVVQPTTAFYYSGEANNEEANNSAVTTRTKPTKPTKPARRTKGEELQVRRAYNSTLCDPSFITPACLLDFYNVDYQGTGRTLLGVTGFLGESASHSDVDVFTQKYFPAGNGTNFGDVTINGQANNASDPSYEGDLDTQIALYTGYPNRLNYYSVGPSASSGFGDAMLNLTSYLNTNSNPPTSISISYAGEEQYFTSAYVNRACNEFMKVGARGISVFASSGDHGVAGNSGRSSCPQGYYAMFPASCPWITAVGATQWDANGTESAAMTFPVGGNTLGASGGGFSWRFKAPAYQAADTAAYINGSLDSSWDGYYSPSGRGYPDVSLVGLYYGSVFNGSDFPTWGTSASAPAWAGLVARINDYRASLGKPSLGFLNTALYQNKTVRAALRDVTTGHNQGCGGYGFPAAAGWDPATGLGTMDFGALRKALGSL